MERNSVFTPGRPEPHGETTTRYAKLQNIVLGALEKAPHHVKRKLLPRLRDFWRRPSLTTPDTNDTEYIWNEIFHDRIYSHPHLKTEAKPLDVVVDIGANVGVFAAWAAREYAPNHIYCYEASPITYQYLRKNVEKLGSIYKDTTFHAVHAAVSNTEGDERQIYHRLNKIGGSTLLEEGRARGGTPLNVRATRLSNQLRARGVDKVDLLKIDVEGHYMEVLEGISDFTQIRRIVLECDWIPEGAPSHRRVIQLLEEKGYAVTLDDPTKVNNVTVYARRVTERSTAPGDLVKPTNAEARNTDISSNPEPVVEQ